MSFDATPPRAATRSEVRSSAQTVDDDPGRFRVRHGLLLVIAVSVAFFGSWWNRYAPPTSGGEAVLMARWATDYFPYRDYFMQAPPGVSILVQGIAAVGGPHLLATLTFGALLRIAGACALYGLLLRVGRPASAAIGALTALLVSSTDISDTPFYYNHIGAALILGGTYLALAGGNGTRAAHYVGAVAGGILLTFAIAVKQTMVFGSAAAFLALLILVWPRPRAGWIGWLLALFLGAAATVGGIWMWLSAHDLVGSFLFVMKRAPEGKGGVLHSLFRPLLLLGDVREAFDATVAAWIVIAIVAMLWIAHRRGTRFRRDIVVLLALLLGLGSILAAFWSGRTTTLFLTALGWWGSLALAALHLHTLRRGSHDLAGRAVVAFGILSFGIGYCFAVSWPLFENMAFPGLAVVVAVMLERPPSDVRRHWAAPVLVLAVAAMGFSEYRKFSSPHTWGLWFDPPIYANSRRFEHPALTGMRISAVSSDLYTLVERVAKEWTAPDERIFVYPNMPILYAIADRRPATYSLAHWVDICPDFLGREDAERLRATPPKLMIIREDSLAFVANEERLYRGGRPSSVRDVIHAFNDLAPGYDRVAVFRSTAASPIVFLVRRDAAALHTR